MSLCLCDHQVLHNIAYSSNFFDFAWIFSLFSLVFRTSKLLECKEFNKTIIPFALVGYETGYSQRGARLFTISYPTRAHGIIVKYFPMYADVKLCGATRFFLAGTSLVLEMLWLIETCQQGIC